MKTSISELIPTNGRSTPSRSILPDIRSTGAVPSKRCRAPFTMRAQVERWIDLSVEWVARARGPALTREERLRRIRRINTVAPPCRSQLAFAINGHLRIVGGSHPGGCIVRLEQRDDTLFSRAGNRRPMAFLDPRRGQS